MAMNFSKSLIYKEILHDGGSIDAQRYLLFLQNMFDAFHETIPRWEITIQHGDARPHVAALVKRWLEGENVRILKQPPYSPDTNLMDRYIFRNYSMFRRGLHFNSSREVEINVEQYLEQVTINKLSKEFRDCKEHFQKVIDTDGDYIPK